MNSEQYEKNFPQKFYYGVPIKKKQYPQNFYTQNLSDTKKFLPQDFPQNFYQNKKIEECKE